MSQLRDFRRLDAAKAAAIEPCQPTTMAKPPSGPGWIHEIKHDGYRMMARRDGYGLSLITRNGNLWTDRFPSIVSAAKALPCKSCRIDGEVVIVDGSGIATFSLLRQRTRVKPEAFLYAFDLLELDAKDLRREPLEKRKVALERLLRKCSAGIQYVDHLEEDGSLFFEHACQLGCEGIVSKRIGSRYVSGRSRDWIKVKNPAAPGAPRLEEEDWNDARRSTRGP